MLLRMFYSCTIPAAWLICTTLHTHAHAPSSPPLTSTNSSAPHLSLINKRHKHPSLWFKNSKAIESINPSFPSVDLQWSPPAAANSVSCCVQRSVAAYPQLRHTGLSMLCLCMCVPCMWACVGPKSFIMSGSQLSRMLKCQRRVRASTCPHVLQSPAAAAATSIKLSHVFFFSLSLKPRTIGA